VVYSAFNGESKGLPDMELPFLGLLPLHTRSVIANCKSAHA